MILDKLIKEENWQDLVTQFSPLQIAKSLPFLTNIQLAYDLLYNHGWNEDIQDYAIKLLETIRLEYSKEWNSSWQYNGFLGLACYLTRRYDERYEALKRALEKTSTPPPQLLIAIANSCDCPGKPPISYDEAIEYLKIALKDYLYVDGVAIMRKIFWLKDDLNNEKYWADILDKIRYHNKIAPSLDPQFIQDKF